MPLPATAEQALKIVVVGGFGVGKTTLVSSVSEIRPLNTEETMTRAGNKIDDLQGVENKSSTTVAFDFGRITLDATSVLYLFGAPGQERFWRSEERRVGNEGGCGVQRKVRENKKRRSTSAEYKHQ